MIASMNIISGLIMLVKNKGRDIGILRTIGLSRGSIMRIFMICGAFTGILGTILGIALGCLFAIYIDPIFSVINVLSGGGVWDPSIRGIYSVPAELHVIDLIKATCLSLGLSFLVTIIPARRPPAFTQWMLFVMNKPVLELASIKKLFQRKFK